MFAEELQQSFAHLNLFSSNLTVDKPRVEPTAMAPQSGRDGGAGTGRASSATPLRPYWGRRINPVNWRPSRNFLVGVAAGYNISFSHMFGLKTRRRNRLRSQPFPASWLEILHGNVPYYGRLSPAEQQDLLGDIRVFVAEKNFEGCGGLEITDEIKVTIAAYACILLLHLRHDYYPRLQSVLVYPDAYPVPAVRRAVGNIVVEGDEMRAGESWRTGVVVISWNHVLHRPTDPGAVETWPSMSSLINSTRKKGWRMAHRCCQSHRCIEPGRGFSAGNTRCC